MRDQNSETGSELYGPKYPQGQNFRKIEQCLMGTDRHLHTRTHARTHAEKLHNKMLSTLFNEMLGNYYPPFRFLVFPLAFRVQSGTNPPELGGFLRLAQKFDRIILCLTLPPHSPPILNCLQSTIESNRAG